MRADIEPPELARLLDFAERPRTQDWSLRAALVRYAQAQPQAVNDVLDLVRRLEWALGQHTAVVERQGTHVWSGLEGAPTSDEITPVVELLRAARELDRLGDLLAAWAVARAHPRPDEDVARVVDDVASRLDALGVPHEDRPARPRQRG